MGFVGHRKKAGELLPKREYGSILSWLKPALALLINSGYFRLDVVGLKHIPKSDNLIFTPNHAGWFTLDTFLTGLVLMEVLGEDRMPYGLGHDVLFKLPILNKLFSMEKGFIPVSWVRNMEKIPKNINLAIYPEGADGNVKPFWKAYQMAPWRSGFVRLALERKSKVVPVSILGGEECFPTAGTLSQFKSLIGAKIPIPVSLLPLPTEWKIIFHPSIDFSKYPKSLAKNPEKCRKIGENIQKIVQNSLDRETYHRPLVKVSRLAKKVQFLTQNSINSRHA